MQDFDHQQYETEWRGTGIRGDSWSDLEGGCPAPFHGVSFQGFGCRVWGFRVEGLGFIVGFKVD